MINFYELNKAYEENRFYALQLEVGDVCYQGCNYCYMNAIETPQNALSDDDIKNILIDSKKLGITAIEWLGGEPLLRKNIFDLMNFAKDLDFRNNMWTGGLPLNDYSTCKKLSEVCSKGLIAFHISSVNPETYKKLHPGKTSNDLQTILNGIKCLLDLGYPSELLLNSVTFTGLQTAEDMIETMNYFYENFKIATSLNVYHTYLRPGYTKEDLLKFIPDKESVKKVYKHYISFLNIEDISVFPMNCVNKQYCSATLAVLNDGTVSPCATIRSGCVDKIASKSFYDIVNENRNYLTFAFLKDKNNLPEECKFCPLNDDCFGCRSRAYAASNGIFGIDPRCFRN